MKGARDDSENEVAQPTRHVADAALQELARLVSEADARFRRGEYVEAMGSLVAVEPLRNLLLTHLYAAWEHKESPEQDETISIGAYL
jgi:hypothetical protein